MGVGVFLGVISDQLIALSDGDPSTQISFLAIGAAVAALVSLFRARDPLKK